MTRDDLAFIVDNTVATECEQLDGLLHDGDAGFVGIGVDFVGYGPMRYVERRPRILWQKMEGADVEEIARLDGRQGAHIIGLHGDDNEVKYLLENRPEATAAMTKVMYARTS